MLHLLSFFGNYANYLDYDDDNNNNSNDDDDNNDYNNNFMCRLKNVSRWCQLASL